MMLITKKSLSRRTFLRGAGTALALPLLDAMIPALTAQSKSAAPVTRYGFVYVPHGVINERWIPDTAGRDFAFKPIIAISSRLWAISISAPIIREPRTRRPRRCG
jgi:hypothetical protein